MCPLPIHRLLPLNACQQRVYSYFGGDSIVALKVKQGRTCVSFSLKARAFDASIVIAGVDEIFAKNTNRFG